MAEIKAKHAFGSSANIESAIASGIIDNYDLLFLDGETDPKVGWIDKDGNVRIVKNADVKAVDSLPESGETGKVYIYNDEGYFWNGTEYKPLSKSVDLTSLEEQIASKASLDEVTAKIDSAIAKTVSYEIAYKPDGTIVDYRDKEIRIMCPSDTVWTLQNSGENADPNKYYIGFKAYAPVDAVNFKEDLAKTISDDTLYSFEGNEFAGIDTQGRKYSIVWLPVAKYDEASDTWTYYGTSSSAEKYIGWYYSVEWYDLNGEVISSDCIRINLSNESCHSTVEPYYVNSAIDTANAYTDEQIQKVVSGIEIIEF